MIAAPGAPEEGSEGREEGGGRRRRRRGETDTPGNFMVKRGERKRREDVKIYCLPIFYPIVKIATKAITRHYGTKIKKKILMCIGKNVIATYIVRQKLALKKIAPRTLD